MGTARGMDRPVVISTKIVHENVDGEVIAINLDSGNYYSLRGTAAEIWDRVAEGLTSEELLLELGAAHATSRDELEEAVEKFFSELIAEGLLTAATSDGFQAASNGNRESGSKSAGQAGFQPPVFEKFSEMQDFLLMDPIHEVDATGWPNRREPDE
jgi:coenzyme PQQ synthesis protein D (PqqD)